MAKRGLGSDKMSERKKKEIQRKGGKASGGSNRGNQGRGSNLTKEDRAKGGRRSHSGGRPSENE